MWGVTSLKPSVACGAALAVLSLLIVKICLPHSSLEAATVAGGPHWRPRLSDHAGRGRGLRDFRLGHGRQRSHPRRWQERARQHALVPRDFGGAQEEQLQIRGPVIVLRMDAKRSLR